MNIYVVAYLPTHLIIRSPSRLRMCMYTCEKVKIKMTAYDMTQVDFFEVVDDSVRLFPIFLVQKHLTCLIER